MEYLFLAKIKDSDDRDCVKYFDLDSGKFECDHYFSSLRISGACFSGFEKEFEEEVNNNYDNLETILTKEELLRLFKFNKEIKDLGYGITKGDERYEKGLKICQSIQDIIDKLMSDENKQLFSKVIDDEKEYCKDEYNLSDEEVNEIFDNYGLDYRDRAIISTIFNSIEECGEEEFDTYSEGQISDHMKQFVDYEAFGRDLIYNSEGYYELESGRVVYYAY
jgi:hypothetical protein